MAISATNRYNNNMKVLITGGTGFIGSHLADMHQERGDDVTVIDNLSTSHEDLNVQRELIRFNLGVDKDMTIIEKCLERADLVYHMASSVGVKYIDSDPKKTLRNSFDVNNVLLPLFEKYNNRVVFASTSEVYGNTTEAYETDTLCIGSPDTLRWGYACGKLMSEFLLKTYDFPSTIVRLFNVTGNRQLRDHGMVLPTFVDQAKRGENIVVYGDGKQFRSFCDIRDAVQMIDIVSGPNHVNEIYNIGNPNNTVTIAQLAELVIKTLDKDLHVVYKSYDDTFSEDFGEIYKRKPNIDKISKYYLPIYTTQDIIKSMI